jgi:hypothetical protein
MSPTRRATLDTASQSEGVYNTLVSVVGRGLPIDLGGQWATPSSNRRALGLIASFEVSRRRSDPCLSAALVQKKGFQL